MEEENLSPSSSFMFHTGCDLFLLKHQEKYWLIILFYFQLDQPQWRRRFRRPSQQSNFGMRKMKKIL
jgi:hypothetical protein